MSNERIRRGEYMGLPALRRDAAAITWGGFFFEVGREDDKEAWRLLDDDKPPNRSGRKQSIGASSEAYAPRSSVFVTEVGTDATQEDPVEAADHAVARDLKINRAPVFLAIGDHDKAEDKQSFDRERIYDNLYLHAGFRRIRDAEDASFDHGSFYRFRLRSTRLAASLSRRCS